jgi:Fic family protein
MSRLPKSPTDLIKILQHRHFTFMEQRPDKLPGQFKVKVNRAGSSVFVEPELVTGTLEKGFEFYASLEVPLHRAIFMMFLISEVHPFADGNGRAARIMMNAELVAGGEQKIIIPIIYRNNYLTALKSMTHNGHTAPLIRMLDFAQQYTNAVNWSDFARAREMMERTNAFMDAAEADNQGIRLSLPG